MARKPREKDDDETKPDDETANPEQDSDDTSEHAETETTGKPEAETTEQPEQDSDDDASDAETDKPEVCEDNGGTNDAQPDAAKLFTQEDVNRIVAERLKRASAKAADPVDLQTQAAKIGELQAQLEALTAELEARRQSDQVAEWKSGVAAQYGVPSDLLRGDSLEALTAHAMQLAEYLKPKTDPLTLGNEPASANVTDDDPRAQFARQIYRLATNN